MDFRALDLSEIKGFSAYMLAEMAGVNSPPSRDSYGARMLTELRDETVQAWEEGRFKCDSSRADIDVCSELASETLTSESHPVFAAWVDVCAWTNGWPEGFEQSPGEWTFTGTVEDMVRASLDDILVMFSMAVVAEIRTVLGAWVCPGCGDTGNPRICWPGKACEGSEEDREAYRASQATAEPAQAASVEAGAVSDPILALIAKVQAEATQADRVTEADRALWDASVKALDPSETQAFMAKMSAANIAEFAERRRKARWVRIGLAVTVALVGVVLIGIGLAGGL